MNASAEHLDFNAVFGTQRGPVGNADLHAGRDTPQAAAYVKALLERPDLLELAALLARSKAPFQRSALAPVVGHVADTAVDYCLLDRHWRHAVRWWLRGVGVIAADEELDDLGSDVRDLYRQALRSAALRTARALVSSIRRRGMRHLTDEEALCEWIARRTVADALAELAVAHVRDPRSDDRPLRRMLGDRDWMRLFDDAQDLGYARLSDALEDEDVRHALQALRPSPPCSSEALEATAENEEQALRMRHRLIGALNARFDERERTHPDRKRRDAHHWLRDIATDIRPLAAAGR